MQSLTIHLAVNNGLGRRASLLDRHQYEGAAKVSHLLLKILFISSTQDYM